MIISVKDDALMIKIDSMIKETGLELTDVSIIVVSREEKKYEVFLD